MSPALGKNWLEWAVFGVGVVLIAATVGYLGLQASKPPVDGPALTVSVGAPRPGPGGYVVPVVVRNAGAGAAENVTLEAALEGESPGTPAETARIAIDYVPGHAERRGLLQFRRDPAGGKLVVGALAYTMP